MKRTAFSSLLALLTLFLLLASGMAVQAAMVSIDGDNVNLRSGPGTKYRVLWELGNGFPLQILKRSGDWYRVQDFEGTIGWVHRKVVNNTPHMIVKVNKNSAKQVNLRSGPGTKNPVVAKAHYGVVFRTLEQKDGWVKVQHEEGVSGWISRNLVWGW